MTVVITGATGFLGSRLLAALLADDRRVVVLTRDGPRSGLSRCDQLLVGIGAPASARAALRSRVTFLAGDVTRPRLGMSDVDFTGLADRVTELWHCAGLIDLQGDPRRLWAVNVGGTRHVLDLLDAAPGPVRLLHVSTAFVAGKRRQGVIEERAHAPGPGFENPYEDSKHATETMIQDWLATKDHMVTLLRPSILITDRRHAAGLPRHPMSRVTDLLGRVLPRRRHGDRVVLRVPGDPRALVNLMPVEHAVRAMLSVARAPASARLAVVHLVDPGGVPIRVVRSVFEQIFDIRIRIVPGLPDDPSPAERRFYSQLAGFMPYFFHRRTYRSRLFDQGCLADVGWPAVDGEYLLRSLVPGTARYAAAFRWMTADGELPMAASRVDGDVR